MSGSYGGGMQVLPVRGKLRVLGMVALGAIVLFVAIGLAAVPSGGARVMGAIAAVLVVGLGVWLLRGMGRQALVVDGSRLGWRRGLTDRVSGWTELSDVELVTASKLNTAPSLRRTDVVLWTRTGGMRGVDAVLLRWQLPSAARQELDARAGTDQPLHPFLVPVTALGDDDRELVAVLLEQHGLGQPPGNTSA